jgi:hypothetical protein
MKSDGSIDRKSAPITGAVDGENVTLTATGFFGLQTATFSGTFEGSNLTLTGVEPTPFDLKRSSLADYQAQVTALNARSQNIIAAKTAAMSRERAEQAQKNFVAQIDQLITKMQQFDSAADVHLGRFPNVEKSYQAITAKMNGYVERERQLAGNPNASNTRHQLSNAATQASFVTDQVHNQGESLQSTFDMNVKPIAAEVTTFEQRCQAVTDAGACRCGRPRVVNRHDRRGTILSVLHPPQDFFLGVDGVCGGEQPPHIVLLSGNDLEVAGGNTHLESWRGRCRTHRLRSRAQTAVAGVVTNSRETCCEVFGSGSLSWSKIHH